MISRRWVGAVLGLGLCSLLAGCKAAGGSTPSGKSEPGASSAAGGPQPTLIVAREEGANSLDIHGVGTNRPAYGTSWNLYDRLISYGTKKSPDGQDMYDYQQLVPELAERWEVDPGGRSPASTSRQTTRRASRCFRPTSTWP